MPSFHIFNFHLYEDNVILTFLKFGFLSKNPPVIFFKSFNFFLQKHHPSWFDNIYFRVERAQNKPLKVQLLFKKTWKKSFFPLKPSFSNKCFTLYFSLSFVQKVNLGKLGGPQNEKCIFFHFEWLINS